MATESSLVNRLVTLVLVLLLQLPLSAGDAVSLSVDFDSITPGRLLGHLSFLASDELEGRDTAERGGELAALYIATHFQSLGLRPGTGPSNGEVEGYFQPFELDADVYEDVVLEMDGKTFELGDDFALFGFTGSGSVDSELVFCGYGITAPEFDYDDYAGVDVSGKVVLLLRHEPREKESDKEFFGGSAHTRHAFFVTKFENALKHGAAGMILINDPVHCGEQRHFGIGGERGIRGLHPAAGRSEAEETKAGAAIFAGKSISEFIEQRVDLSGLQTKIDDTKAPSSSSTGVSVSVRLRRSSEVLNVANVAAILPGSDPVLKDEYIILGGHFDHEGVQGGEIMNGANDNASGTTGLLAIAEAFALQPTAPRRSVLFIAFNAEEKGLLGSRYYVEHPLVSLSQTAAMLNMDMIGRSTKDTVNLSGGALCSVLDSVSRSALKRVGITEPSFGDTNINARSDHYPFFARGVPILVFYSDDFADYHTPQDTLDKLTLEQMHRIVHSIALTAWGVANVTERPLLKNTRRF